MHFCSSTYLFKSKTEKEEVCDTTVFHFFISCITKLNRLSEGELQSDEHDTARFDFLNILHIFYENLPQNWTKMSTLLTTSLTLIFLFHSCYYLF